MNRIAVLTPSIVFALVMTLAGCGGSNDVSGINSGASPTPTPAVNSVKIVSVSVPSGSVVSCKDTVIVTMKFFLAEQVEQPIIVVAWLLGPGDNAVQGLTSRNTTAYPNAYTSWFVFGGCSNPVVSTPMDVTNIVAIGTAGPCTGKDVCGPNYHEIGRDSMPYLIKFTPY